MIDLALAVNYVMATGVLAASMVKEWGSETVKTCKVINFTNI